jgi:porin
LVERGVHVQAGYFGEGLGTLSGGLRREAVYEGLLEGAVNLDLERLLGWWRGASLRVSALVPHGRSPSGRLTGDLQTLSNIDAEDGVALYELWLEQSWAADRVSVRAGQLLADAEFATTDYAAALIHSAFGWPASISANARNTGPAYPRAALGLRTRWEPSAAWQFQAGVFDGDTFDANGAGQLGNDHGTSMHLSGNQGAFVIAEAAWRHHHDTNAPGLPGVLKVGGWWHTATFADVQVDGQTHGANGGLYVASQQLVWRETDGTEQGLGVFLRAGWAPSDRNLFSVAGDGGVHYLGPVPGRDDDVVALGVAMAWMSGDVRDAARADGVSPLPDYELAVELSYQANLRPWLAVQPVFQWIRHPGGSAAIDDALVAGLRFRLTF